MSPAPTDEIGRNFQPREPDPSDDAHAILAEALDQGYCVVEVLLNDREEPRDYRFVYVNHLFAAFTGISPEDALSGRTARELVPGLENHWVRTYGKVALTGEPERFEAGSEAMGRWFAVRAFRLGGSDCRSVGILFTDVTAERREEARRSLLAGIADDSASLSSEAEIVRAIGARVTAHLSLSACLLYRVDERLNEITPLGGWAAEGLPSVFRNFSLSRFHSEEFRRAMNAGETVAILDTAQDPRVDASAHAAIDVASFVAVPLRREGEWRMVLAAADVRPRAWKDHEVELLEAVAARVFPRLEGARAEEALRGSEARYRALSMASSDVAYGLSADWSVMLPMDGRGFVATTEKPIRGWFEMNIPLEERERVWAAIQRAIESKSPFDLEHRVSRPDGSIGRTRSRAIPILDDAGNLVEWFGAASDITERKAAEEALQRVNEELEAKVLDRTAQLSDAVREAEGFNYSVAHDLRAPVRAVSSTSRILLDEVGQELEPEYRDMLERQVTNARRLGTLIDELLRLSRLARAEVNGERLDMTALVRSVAVEIDPPCRVEVQEGMTAEGDPDLVRTVLHNLIGNACKFSPEGGTVRVGQADGAFFVKDEGIGFDMQYAPKLFLPFERLVTEEQFEGTGIGLANVERIVRRHGGRVWAESDGPGKGATFYFTLSGEQEPP